MMMRAYGLKSRAALMSLSVSILAAALAAPLFAQNNHNYGWTITYVEGYVPWWASDFNPASGTQFPYTVNNIPSWELQGNALNFRDIVTVNMPTFNGIGWNVTLEAFSPSWLSELALLAVNVNGVGIILRPGAGNNVPGTGTFSSPGIVKFADVNIQDIPLPDGKIYLEFYETYNDFTNAIDGYWRSGTITFQAVPEPASMIALGSGLVGLLALRRRRQRV